MPRKLKMINFKSEGTSAQPAPVSKEAPVHVCTPKCSAALGKGTDAHFARLRAQTSIPAEDRPRDPRNRRIITKESLLEGPPIIIEDEEIPKPPSPAVSKPVKQKPQLEKRAQRPNRLERKFNKVLSQPIVISKAESMMQKMGWGGGALGKAEDGILEPIVPNLTYAINTKGFGQEEPTPKKAKEKPKKQARIKPPVCPLRVQARQRRVNDKKQFKVNVLNAILEFVKNENEVEILFDCDLHNGQRKYIHNIIEEIRTTSDLYDVDSLENGDFSLSNVVIEIFRRNKFVLMTQSEGEDPLRYLCLFKEAPEHMYVVTHLDLREQSRIVKIPFERRVNGKKMGKKLRRKIGLTYKGKRALRAEKLERRNKANLDPDVTVIDEETPEKSIKLNRKKEITNNNENTEMDAESNKSVNNENNKYNLRSRISDLNGEKSIKIDDSDSDEPYEEYEFDEKFSSDDEADTTMKIDEHEKNTSETDDITEKLANDTNESSNLISSNNLSNEVILIDSEDEDESLTKPNSILDIKTLYNEYTNKKTAIRKKVHGFFAEFVNGVEYTEFRFLGDFENDELEVKNEFIKKVWLALNEEPVTDDEDLARVLRQAKYSLSMKEDCNGSTVIIKDKKFNF